MSRSIFAGVAHRYSKKKSTSYAAAARAEPGAAVVSRIERPGLGPSAQRERGTGEAALVATASAVPTSTLLVTGAALQVAPNISPSRTGTDSLAARSTRRFPAWIVPPSCAEPSTWTSRAAPGAQGAIFDVPAKECGTAIPCLAPYTPASSAPPR